MQIDKVLNQPPAGLDPFASARLIRTAARWKIPRDVALEVLARDQRCIYCSREFDRAGPRVGVPSWEHIVNDLSQASAANIALCCVGCNASKGMKSLTTWLESDYCRVRGITGASVSPIAVRAIHGSEHPA